MLLKALDHPPFLFNEAFLFLLKPIYKQAQRLNIYNTRSISLILLHIADTLYFKGYIIL